LKYYILKVDPKKRILLKEESVDFAGNTGPFIQYTYARFNRLFVKLILIFQMNQEWVELHAKEKELLKQLELFPEVIQMQPKIIVLPWQIMYMI
jgi:arginyl-tRNA synthetase